jgi:hypothetical protein
MAKKELSNERILVKSVETKLIFVKTIHLCFPVRNSEIETTSYIDEALELDEPTMRWYMTRLESLNQFSLSSKFICNDHV